MEAVALLSGGLDSTLAIKLILEQGIEVKALNFFTVFCTCTPKRARCFASVSAAQKLGVSLKIFDISEEYLQVVKDPKYGYGSQMNPCIDCRIMIFRKAREYMEEIGAKFIVTGEVLDERPMSQRRQAMEIIERESGLEGLIVRPLSAKLLPPSIPERKGWVDRKRFLDIRGRSRKPQIQLARRLGISDYPCPAGGCLLTDPGFANRMRDLLKYNPGFDLNDVKLLKIGRHFRFPEGEKLIVGRNEFENKELFNLAKDEDYLFEPIGRKGPVALLRGKPSPEVLILSLRIVARYCNSAKSQVLITYWKARKDQKNISLIEPSTDDLLLKYRI
jgi:tRNA U34 2-thiouridine synthase MnmA/TrmU